MKGAPDRKGYSAAETMVRDNESAIADLLFQLDMWPGPRDGGKSVRMTNDLYPYTSLFSPLQVNGVWIKNRIVMGPMGNLSAAEEMGRPSRKMIDYFVERARGGVGLITSGLVPVSHGIDPAVTEPGGKSYFPRIDGSRTVFSGWRDLAEFVHAFGARFFIQLTAGVGRVGSPECLLIKHTLPVSSSWNPNYYLPGVPCRPLSDRQCMRIIRAAAQASADAQAMLIDGVYLHGHEGYLLEQMVNPAFNRRIVGRFAQWQAFGLELVRRIRARVGPRYPIMYRIDLSLALRASYGARMNTVRTLKKFRRERTVEMTLDYMENLVTAGVDIFDVDLGCYENWWLPHPPSSIPSGCFLQVARIVKEHFAERRILSNAGLPVPIVAVGKLGYPDLAEQALRDGLCDMIMLARPLLADAHWANKAFAGKTIEICPCIGDQEACLKELIEGGHPQCSVNPRTGFEDAIPNDLVSALKPQKVVVVGSGPAGVLCAVTAAQRGHSVTLFEARDRIGGMLVPGSRPKIKYEVANYLAFLENLVERTRKSHPLEVLLQTEADADLLRDQRFDTLVICTGGKPAVPSVAGVDGPQVLHAIDVLRNPERAGDARRVVVVDGGSAGCECAHFLAVEMGKQVTVIEMLPHLMKGICTANRAHLIHVLEQAGVTLLNCAKLKSISMGAVVVERNVSPTVPDPYITWTPLLPENIRNPLARSIRQVVREDILPVDLVVLATGLTPDFSLYETCLREAVAPRIYHIGDAFQVGRVFEAVKAGFSIGRAI